MSHTLSSDFAEYLQVLTKGQAGSARFVLAVSGGSDSMALLHLMKDAFPRQCPVVVTVDHQLRPESSEEAQMVAAFCKTMDIEHHILVWQHGGVVEGNLQATARKARYELLAQFCQQRHIPFLLTGHTQDDQVETIAFMRARGAGEIGLAGMSGTRRLTENVRMLRPMLALSRAELRDYLRAKQVLWCDDPSNENLKFDRIRIRKALEQNPQQREELLHLGKKMAQKRIAIEKTHSDWVDTYIQHDGKGGLQFLQSAFDALSMPQAAYTLGRMLCYLNGRDYPPRYAKREHAAQKIRNGDFRPFTLGLCRISQHLQEVVIDPEAPRDAFISTMPLVPDFFFPIFRDYESK